MYKLYWSEGTASLAPHIILEEAKVEYELILVDTAKSQHRTTEFLKVNPFGKVPAMTLPDGEVMTEAAAICLYLIEKHNLDHLAPLPNTKKRAQYLKWIIYLTNTVQENYKRYYYNDRFLPDGGDSDGIREVAVKDLIDFWKPVEDALKISQGVFMLGKEMSLLDIYIAMLVTWFQPMEDLLDKYPALKNCFNETNKHPSVEAGMKLQNKISVGVIK